MAAPLLGVLAMTTALFWRVLSFKSAFYLRDLHLQWQPQIETFVQGVAFGHAPFWDPHVGFGQPLLANANTEVLYPLTWLNLLVPAWLYLTVFVLVHFALSGVGTYRLTRVLGLSRTAATLSAVCWMASGPFLSLVNVWSHFGGAAWMPWVIYASGGVCEGRAPSSALKLGLFLGLILLAGSPDYFLFSALLSGVWILASAFRLAAAKKTLEAVRLLGLLLLSCVTALGLAAAQLLPSWAVVNESARRALPAAVRTAWSLDPRGLVDPFVPIQLHELSLKPELVNQLYEAREPYLFSLYLGLASGVLVAAGVSSRKARVPLVWAVLCVLLALGRHTFVHAAASAAIPLLAMMRFPVKAMVPFALAWSVLAGIGLDAAFLGPTRRRRLAWIAGAALFVSLGVVFWVGPGQALMAADRLLDLSAPHGLSRWLVALQRAALLLGLVSAAVLLGRTFNHPVPARVAVLLLVGLDLALPNERINPVAPVSLYRFQPPALAYVPASHQERVYVYDYDHGFARSPSLLRRPDPYRMTLPDSDALRWVEAVGMRSYLAPPTAAAWGRFNSFDADALGIQPRPLRELNELFGRLEDGDPMRVRLLQMGAVSRVVALHAVAGLETLAALRSYFPDPVRVLRVPDPLPRAYYVSRAVQADGAEAAAWLVSTAFDPRREVILAESTATATDTLECSGAVTIERLTTDSVRIAAETACPGYVVLSDAYDPGWSARVDGRWAPLLRANLAFRAVPVEAGRHAIEMRYRPRLLGPGLTLSAATLLGLVWFRLRPARRRPSSAAGIRSPAR